MVLTHQIVNSEQIKKSNFKCKTLSKISIHIIVQKISLTSFFTLLKPFFVDVLNQPRSTFKKPILRLKRTLPKNIKKYWYNKIFSSKTNI